MPSVTEAGSALPSRFRRVDEIATPVVIFVMVYLALTALWVLLIPGVTLAAAQWCGLGAAVGATAAAGWLRERRLPPIGLEGPIRRSIGEVAASFLLAMGAILAAHALIMMTAGSRMVWGEGVGAAEVFALMLPAALHEEILMRGYAFQRLAAWSRTGAVAIGSLVFALLHLANLGMGTIAFMNIMLGGVLLSLAFFIRSSLWVPIGLHFGWNFASGPVLGHEVSGYDPESSLWRTIDGGPRWLSGGSFGIEASLWITLVELALIALLIARLRNGSRPRGVSQEAAG